MTTSFEPPRPAETAPPVWRRSSTDRLIAGVCGGVGRRLGIDPVILRILTVVLVFFGGAGIVLYAAGWLFLQSDRTDRTVLEEAFDAATADRTRSVLLSIGLVIVLVIATAAAFEVGGLVAGMLVALVVIGVLMLARRDAPRPTWQPTAPPAPGPAYSFPMPPATSPRAQETAMPQSSSSDPTLTLPPPGFAGSSDPPGRYGTPASPYQPPGSSYGPAGPPPAYQPPAPPYGPPTQPMTTEPPAPPPPRERSHLGLLTISVIFVAMGALALVDLSGATVPAAAYIASALGITALGLVLGAWYGRSRGLIALGLVLGLALGPAAVADEVTDGDWRGWRHTEEIDLRPLSADDLQLRYEYGAATMRLDLTDIAGDRDLATRIEVGGGEVFVLVPPEMDVTVDAESGIGEVQVFDDRSGGFGSSRSTTDLGVDGAGGSTLDLKIEMGVGRVEVRRAAA